MFTLASFLLPAIIATSPQAPSCCTLVSDSIAQSYHVAAVAERRFTHADLWAALLPYDGVGDVVITEVGRSVQDRAIRAVTFGTGPTRVLLWSQMHGDESTATMALADIVSFLAQSDSEVRATIHDALTVVMVPMLNPDGAEVFRRYNAVGVDINRDARRVATPEARVLKGLRDSLAPAFGFNLHDQSARNLAGAGGQQVAIALLAPAADSARSYGPVRTRARKLAALLAHGLAEVIPGRTAKYDDTFNPRAFGDLVQQWGTSTILIESGALPDDPQKHALRGLNVRLILTALRAIATNGYAGIDIAAYETLPFNESVPADVLVRGGRVVLPSGARLGLDLALRYDDPVGKTGLTLHEVGDLQDVIALDTVNVDGNYVHLATPSTLDPADWMLTRGERVAVTVRSGPTDTSAVIMRVPE
jgi:hypothetical protein